MFDGPANINVFTGPASAPNGVETTTQPSREPDWSGVSSNHSQNLVLRDQ
jgi:hypothetical protein